MENTYTEVNAFDPSQVLNFPMHFKSTCDRVFEWGVARNITAHGGATALSQIKKLKEEVAELEEGLELKDEGKVIDGIGDTLVVLLNICRLSGMSLDQCLFVAYNEIKDRKGTMIDGVFVKE